jgi:hypothetical protein
MTVDLQRGALAAVAKTGFDNPITTAVSFHLRN